MLPLARVVSAGHGIHPVFAWSLPAALNFDPARAAESMWHWLRFAEMVNRVDVTGANPLGWLYTAAAGLERLKGATVATPLCLAEIR